MESWQKVWRDAVAGLISNAGLEALRKALVEDDPRLLQGATTNPPPLMIVAEWPVEAACPLALPGWLGDDHKTVMEVETYFAEVCSKVCAITNEPAAVSYFLNWVDETPRPEMRRLLLVEVNATILQRQESKEQSTALVQA